MLIERRTKHRLMNQINVVPYIDVMLVLLVIFMVTAPLINPGQVELPQIGKTSNPPVQPMEVSIRTDQSLWLRDRARGSSERRVTRNDLIQAIKEKQARSPDQAVVISADKDVRYESVLEVMDMLQQNQVRKVGLLAKPRTP
ncbi:MAG: biopolymer transport protein TolR [Betaproteobacteria bacterium]|jgi:biopolymer transport protein TolR|nr:biopolymer transport protein TolR [Betaproteobacteria bacterium]